MKNDEEIDLIGTQSIPTTVSMRLNILEIIEKLSNGTDFITKSPLIEDSLFYTPEVKYILEIAKEALTDVDELQTIEGIKWTSDEDRLILSEYIRNYSDTEIAKSLGRSLTVIQKRLQFLLRSGLYSRPWTDEEICNLKNEYNSGKNVKELSMIFGCSIDTLVSALTKNKINSPYDETACIYKNREKYMGSFLYSASEEKDLRDQYLSGMDIREIAKIHGRSEGAIVGRLKKMKVFKDY